MGDVNNPNGQPADNPFQAPIDAESADEFVHSQTTRPSTKYEEDMKEMNQDERKIERFISNGEKNRFMNIACYDEELDTNNKDFYVHANTFKTPYGNYIISQAPMEDTRGDHYHLMWLYNVRTVVCMVPPEQAGGYFDLKEGGEVTVSGVLTNVVKNYKMKTIAIFDEKQGITVYQCVLKSPNGKKDENTRMIYIICCPTESRGVRSTRMQSVAMEYMWSFEETEFIEKRTTTVLVHGISGTRRCASFVASAVMCKQILETGKFSSMDTWVELRKRRCCTCARKHDFYSSLANVFMFCVQCALYSGNDPNHVKTLEIINAFLKEPSNDADQPKENSPAASSSKKD